MNGRNKISKAKIINFPNNWVTQFEVFERGRRLIPRFNTYCNAMNIPKSFPIPEKRCYIKHNKAYIQKVRHTAT